MCQTEFCQPVSTLGEIHDGLSQKSENEQPQFLSGDEADVDLSLDQDQEQNQEHSNNAETVTTPTRKKDIKVIRHYFMSNHKFRRNFKNSTASPILPP